MPALAAQPYRRCNIAGSSAVLLSGGICASFLESPSATSSNHQTCSRFCGRAFGRFYCFGFFLQSQSFFSGWLSSYRRGVCPRPRLLLFIISTLILLSLESTFKIRIGVTGGSFTWKTLVKNVLFKVTSTSCVCRKEPTTSRTAPRWRSTWTQMQRLCRRF